MLRMYVCYGDSDIKAARTPAATSSSGTCSFPRITQTLAGWEVDLRDAAAL